MNTVAKDALSVPTIPTPPFSVLPFPHKNSLPSPWGEGPGVRGVLSRTYVTPSLSTNATNRQEQSRRNQPHVLASPLFLIADTSFSPLLDPLASPIGLKASLALTHFLWQGVLIAAIAAILMRLVARRSPQRRYLIGMTGIVLMALAPIITFACVTPPPPLPTRAVTPEPLIESQFDSLLEVEELDALLAGLGTKFPPLPEQEPTEPVPPLTWQEQLQLWQPYALAFWLAGSALFALRLAIGVRGIRRFSRAARPLPCEWTASAAKVASRLGLKAPRIFVSDRVVEAVAIGFLKPMVLVPTSWIGNVPLDVLEAVLAHELVHLKRYDLWANLLQRCVETVLFYHPAVWWLSRQVRIEREYCCDETAATAISGRAAYARALEFVATERVAATRPRLYGTALAAGMGRNHMALLHRVHRVLAADGKPPRGNWLSEGLLALALPIALWAGIATVGPVMADELATHGAVNQNGSNAGVASTQLQDSVKDSSNEMGKTVDEELPLGADVEKLMGTHRERLEGPLGWIIGTQSRQYWLYRVEDGRTVASQQLLKGNEPWYEGSESFRFEGIGNNGTAVSIEVPVIGRSIFINAPEEAEIDGRSDARRLHLNTISEALRRELDALRGDKKTNARPKPLIDVEIEAALDKPISLSLNEVPLKKLIDQLRDQAETNFVIDQAGLDEEGVTTETPISIGVNNVSLRSALNLILSPMNLGYVHEDEVIKITSRTRTLGPFDVKTYPVSDLLTPAGDGKEEKDIESTKAPMTLDALIELITGTIEPNSWDIVGGQGIIRPNPQTQSLVIRQSQNVHGSIEQLLDTLRRLSANAASSPSESSNDPVDVSADRIELERLLKASKFSSLHREYQEAVAAHEKALRIWQEAQRTHAADPSIGAIFLERAQQAQNKVEKLTEEMAKQGLATPRIMTPAPPVMPAGRYHSVIDKQGVPQIRVDSLPATFQPSPTKPQSLTSPKPKVDDLTSKLRVEYEKTLEARDKALEAWREAVKSEGDGSERETDLRDRYFQLRQHQERLLEEFAKRGLQGPAIRSFSLESPPNSGSSNSTWIDLYGDGKKYRVRVGRVLSDLKPVPADPPTPPSAPTMPLQTPPKQATPPSPPPVPLTGDATKATNISRVTTLDIDGKKVEVVIEEIRDPDSKGPAKELRLRMLRESPEGTEVFSDPAAAQRALESEKNTTETSFEEHHKKPPTTPGSKEPESLTPTDAPVTEDIQSQAPSESLQQRIEEYNQAIRARNYAEAISIANKALEIAPKDPAAIAMLFKARLLSLENTTHGETHIEPMGSHMPPAILDSNGAEALRNKFRVEQQELVDQWMRRLAETSAERQKEYELLQPLIDDYNELIETHSYPEAILVSKQARETAPESPIPVPMLYKAKVLYEQERTSAKPKTNFPDKGAETEATESSPSAEKQTRRVMRLDIDGEQRMIAIDEFYDADTTTTPRRVSARLMTREEVEQHEKMRPVDQQLQELGNINEAGLKQLRSVLEETRQLFPANHSRIAEAEQQLKEAESKAKPRETPPTSPSTTKWNSPGSLDLFRLLGIPGFDDHSQHDQPKKPKAPAEPVGAIIKPTDKQPVKAEKPKEDNPLQKPLVVRPLVGKILDTRTSDTSGKQYAAISLGSDDGFYKGLTLYAYRGNKYLGKVKLTNIYSDRSVGEVVEREKGADIRPEDTVRPDKKREQ